jgi:predicted acylesterase/phospholipase RssA
MLKVRGRALHMNTPEYKESDYFGGLRRAPTALFSLSGGGFRAALFHAGVLRGAHSLGLIESGIGNQAVVNAVSGGAIPALIWDRFLRTAYRRRASNEWWPERAILELVVNAPAVGGQFNWLVRRLTLSSGWLAYLNAWWTRNATQLGACGPSASGTHFFVQALDFLHGDTWVHAGDRFVLPKREFYKTGDASSYIADVSVPEAIAAATAFPILFPPMRVVTHGVLEHELMDAGLIDNLALHGFLSIFSGPQSLLPADKQHLWILSDAGRAMAKPDTTSHTTAPRTTKRIGLVDRIMRLTGDLAQPSYQAWIVEMLRHHAHLRAVGLRLGITPRLYPPEVRTQGAEPVEAPLPKPWTLGSSLRTPEDAVAVPTGLFPLSIHDAAFIIALGAQACINVLAERTATVDSLHLEFMEFIRSLSGDARSLGQPV